MMTDDVLNERLGLINDNARGWQSRSSNLASTVPIYKRKLWGRVELMQGNYLSKSEAKIGAGMTAVITVIGFMDRFNCESCE